MMDSLSVSNFVAYNAQVACVTLVAIVLPSLLRVHAPYVRYTYWRATAFFCLLLPWLPLPESGRQAPVESTVTTTTARVAFVAGPVEASIDWWSIVALIAVAGGVLRIAWIVAGAIRLQRLRKAGNRKEDDEHRRLQELAGTRADIRYVPTIQQPVTFGLRQPVILLPESLRSRDTAVREAVIVHELTHVRRRDWAWLLVEETIRSIFWFHPAVWWLISRVQQAREELVDACVVRATGRRRAYVEALLAFAGAPPAVGLVPTFARRRHLFRRILLLSGEGVMSRSRLIVSCAVLVSTVVLGGWYAVRNFPLLAAASPQALQTAPGPLEQAAHAVTAENPVPRRIHYVAPEYPSEAAGEEAHALVTLRLTVDGSGGVGELRMVGFGVKTDSFEMRAEGDDTRTKIYQFLQRATSAPSAGGAPFRAEAARPLVDAFIRSAAAAAGQWRYDAPLQAPITFDVTISFSPTGGAGMRGNTVTPTEWGGAIRVGGNVKMPRKLRDVRPIYPADAQESRVQGIVVLEVRINGEGRITDARVLRSIPMLDQAALDAARQWEFEPTLLNGNPTAVVGVVTVNFTLQ